MHGWDGLEKTDGAVLTPLNLIRLQLGLDGIDTRPMHSTASYKHTTSFHIHLFQHSYLPPAADSHKAILCD